MLNFCFALIKYQFCASFRHRRHFIHSSFIVYITRRFLYLKMYFRSRIYKPFDTRLVFCFCFFDSILLFAVSFLCVVSGDKTFINYIQIRGFFHIPLISGTELRSVTGKDVQNKSVTAPKMNQTKRGLNIQL